MGEVEELYKQLQQLRSQLPELMQILATVSDSKSSRETFHEVAQSVSAWHTAALAFAQRYRELGDKGILRDDPKPKDQSNMLRNDFDYGFDLDMGNLGDDFRLETDMLDEGIGNDLLTDDFLNLWG